MQRTGALIERLQQQYKQSVSNEELAVTVQFLLAELQNNSQVAEQRNYVSIIMPEVQPFVYNGLSSNIPDDFVPEIKQSEVEKKPVEEEVKPIQPAVEQKPAYEKVKPVTPVAEPKPVEEEAKPVKPVAEEKSVEEAKSNKSAVEEKQILLFSEEDIDDEELQDIDEEKETEPEETVMFARKEPPEEKASEPVSVVAPPKKENAIYNIPTFALKQQELNEKNAASPQQSLHDKYKSTGNESSVRNEPIKDLRKAIGINDRYRFISELFRNDETMYERSIKTINTFSVLSEAEYWISRELKLKIGWSEDSETVKDFDQLIRRRFS